MKSAKIHCAYFFFYAMSVAAMFSILPIVQPQPMHPYSSWYPFDVNTVIKVYMTAFYEAICLLSMALLNVSTDVLLYMLIGIVYYQIQLLGLRLTQMGWNECERVNRAECERSVYYKRMIECISLHQEINWFVFRE